MNPLLKFLLLSLCCLILTALPIHAEEKSWYSIDGIKFRTGTSEDRISFYLLETELQDSSLILYNGSSNDLIPVAITFSETLWSPTSIFGIKLGTFSGAVFEFQPKTEIKDVLPYNPDNDNSSTELTTTYYLRQRPTSRTELYNNFFNASDKAFADANSNWALSADVALSNAFLGY